MEPNLKKLDHFFGQFPEVKFGKEQPVIQPGETPKGIYYVKNGYARLYSISAEGQEITLNLFKPGAYFSMIWALSGQKNNFFFEAFTPMTAHLAPKQKVLDFLKQEPPLFCDLFSRIMSGINGLLSQMEFLVFGDAKNKIASQLLILAKRFGRKQKNRQVLISLPLTHRQIANLAGLTRETTSLIMKDLQKKGLINYQRKNIKIVDPEKLQQQSLIFEETPQPPNTL